MKRNNIQLDDQGRLRHFLSVEGLPRTTLTEILDTAESLASAASQNVKKVPLLRGKTIVNLFFEPSTRTRTTFELAAKRLSADSLNMNISASSTSKGESLLDMLHNLEAMQCDMFVVRHAESGAAHFIARNVGDSIAVVNAGDGQHAHPTQAMLDMFTIRRHKGEFHNLRVAIVGDVGHSRVARSQIHALTTLGVPEVRVIGPKTLIPESLRGLGVHIYHDLDEGLDGVDVVLVLRLQNERMGAALLPSEREYFHLYGITAERLERAADDAIVLHPGPINRGVEIDSEVADGERSVILEQVTHGIAVRMAAMSLVMGQQPGKDGEARA